MKHLLVTIFPQDKTEQGGHNYGGAEPKSHCCSRWQLVVKIENYLFYVRVQVINITNNKNEK